MSGLTVTVTDADFSRAAGFHRDPFVAPTDLLFGYDFRDFANWNQGIVSGQSATAYLHDYNAATLTPSLAGISRSLDGLGLALTDSAAISLGLSLPRFSNNDGVGKTFMALAGNDRLAGIVNDAIYLNIGFSYSSGGIRLGTVGATTIESIGAGVMSASMQPSLQINQKSDQSNLIFLRANGNGTWTMYIPNSRRTAVVLATQQIPTDSDLGVSDPVATNFNSASTGAGPIWIGSQVGSPANTRPKWPQTTYQVAGWGRALTDAEMQEQYVRSRLRFAPILN